jgi:LPXTG-motif cell wall-anchored protein
MPARTPRLLAALLALLLGGGLATARADSGAPAATTTTIAPASTTPTATTPSPPPAAVAAPPPAETPATTTTPAPSPDSSPAAAGRVTVTTAVKRTARHHVPTHALRARAAAASAVTIRDFSFGPAAITVHAGDTVTWVNDGPTDHTATGSGFDTGTLAKGQSGSHTFTTAGTFSYHCSIHPFMKGTVTVLASAASAGGTTSGAGSSAGGTGAGTAAAATPSAATATTPAGATLPRTGSDPPLLAVAGLIVLLAGLALRRTMRM